MTDADRAILELKARFWRCAGAKWDAMRSELGRTPPRYYQRVRALTTDPEAVACAAAATRRPRARVAPGG